MNDIGRMHEKKPSKNLIDKILNVVLSEVLPWINDSMQVCFHKLSNDINVYISSSRLWLKYIYKADDVLVLEKF